MRLDIWVEFSDQTSTQGKNSKLLLLIGRSKFLEKVAKLGKKLG